MSFFAVLLLALLAILLWAATNESIIIDGDPIRGHVELRRLCLAW